MPLYRFGNETNGYDFSEEYVFLGKYQDNFADTDPQSVRLPGLSGGFDVFGASSVAPTPIGRITQELTLVSETRAGMDAKRDALRALATWGKQMLILRPTNYPTQAERYCYARVKRVQMVKMEDRHTDRWQPATIEWEVSDPRWLVSLSNGMKWGEAWGGLWGDAPATITAAGVQTDAVIVYNGNVPNQVRVQIAGGADPATNPRIQRIASGLVVEEVRFTGAISSADLLDIDARRQRVRLNYADAYDDDFSALTASWLTLVPGLNTLRVVMDGSGDDATVSLYYEEAYR